MGLAVCAEADRGWCGVSEIRCSRAACSQFAAIENGGSPTDKEAGVSACT